MFLSVFIKIAQMFQILSKGTGEGLVFSSSDGIIEIRGIFVTFLMDCFVSLAMTYNL